MNKKSGFEFMETLTILSDREVMHKLLDKILDSNGKENSAILIEFVPGFPYREQARQITYRLTIDASKDVTYTEL